MNLPQFPSARFHAMDRMSVDQFLPTISVFVVTCHGAAERTLSSVLGALHPQLHERDQLIVLDGSGQTTGYQGYPKVRIASLPGKSVFELRSEIPALATGDITVILEDHSIPSSAYLSKIRRIFAEDDSVIAIKALARNDTSTDGWSTANFFFGFGECVHPQDALPCGTMFGLSIVRTSLIGTEQPALGAMELKILPQIYAQTDRVMFSNEIHIDHVQHRGLFTCLDLRYANQRSMGGFEALLNGHPLRLAYKALKDLPTKRARRLAAGLEGRPEWAFYSQNRMKVLAIGWAAAIGTVVGALFGPGKAMYRVD